MAQLDLIDRQALEALGGSTDFLPNMGTMSYPGLPLAYVTYNLSSEKILSCSIFEQDGERRLMFSIPTSGDTLMRIVYDEAAARDFVINFDSEATRDRMFSFETFFAAMTAGEEGNRLFGVFFGSPTEADERPPTECGFEGVWDFVDTPLDRPLVLHYKVYW
jgi:hypothetical protein